MSSSLSDLRNFRIDKSPNGKLANGRKRIRAMSDSSDDGHHHQQQQPQKQHKTTINGKIELSVQDKENKLQNLKRMCAPNADYMILQDALAHNGWDVDKAHQSLPKNLLKTNSDSSNNTNTDVKSYSSSNLSKPSNKTIPPNDARPSKSTNEAKPKSDVTNNLQRKVQNHIFFIQFSYFIKKNSIFLEKATR